MRETVWRQRGARGRAQKDSPGKAANLGLWDSLLCGSPRLATRNDPTRSALAGMDKLFRAVVVSGLLALALFTLARDTAVEAPAYAVRQRH